MKNIKSNLLSSFADASDELLRLKIISTDSFTGEIGEYIVCHHFKLIKAARVTKDIDATDSNGNNYQVKAKIVTKNNFGYRISGLNPKSFRYLVVVYFDELYIPIKIVKIDSKAIEKDSISLSNNLLEQKHFEIVEGSKIRIPQPSQKAISTFAKLYLELKKNKIIRTRHVVGDIGEYIACEKLGLIINEKSNTKGIDATHPTNGLTFEIKTRRVYQSERRNGEGRRINGLEGKSADYLIVVTLDRDFSCSGMWIMPIKNIVNPKSAHLNIVNNTIGVESVIPSKISWLQTAPIFSAFPIQSKQKKPREPKAFEEKTIQKEKKIKPSTSPINPTNQYLFEPKLVRQDSKNTYNYIYKLFLKISFWLFLAGLIKTFIFDIL